MNVRILQILTISLLATSLAGCANFSFGTRVKPIEVMAKPMDRTPLDIPLPEPLRIKPFEWVLVTPGNAEEVFAKLEQRGDDLVVIGLTDEGYQQLAITIAELRNLINLQRNIILKYQEYYEPKQDAGNK